MSPNSTPTNPNEQLAIPQWLKEDYFYEILEKDVTDFSKIIKFTPIAATGPGENYTSTMLRVCIDIQLKDGSTSEISYILKTMLENTAGGKLVNSMNLFPKEKEVYQSLLPKFEALYSEVGKEVLLGPKCLKIEETPERITLVMEDLKRKQFKNVDRLQGLDMLHMRNVLRKLAEFHAASAVYEERNGPYSEHFHKSFFSESNRKSIEQFHELRDTIYKRAMHTWGLDNIEYYIEKLPTVDSYFKMVVSSNEVNPTEFNVLNHGDCWSNNVMFNYNERGDIGDTCLVDFQICKWGTPAQDLWYLITASSDVEIKTKEFDRFIQIYHEHLVECLKLLSYSKTIPKLKDIHMMILKYSFWGLFTATGVMTVTLLQPDQDANIDMMLMSGEEAEKFRYKAYSNPIYARAMCEILPFLDKRGALDFN